MRRRSQRGVAVVLALLLTALSVVLVTGIFWQQQVLVRSMEGERLRTQGRLVAQSGIEVARLQLLDAAAQANVITLDGGWTTPVRQNELAQRITDAQSRFNLRNLAPNGHVDLFQVTAFGRLLAALKLDAGLAYRVADFMAGASKGIDAEQLNDLRGIAGFTPDTLDKLRDFVVVLPESTPINVNTASPEVLTSVVNFSLPEARALAERRHQAYFKGPSDFAFRLNDRETLEGVNYDVSSSYFLVSSEVRLSAAVMRMQGLLRRGAGQAGAQLMWLRQD